MRVSREEKDRTHERIVRSAARLLRAKGPDGTGVADVMSDAGLTHGGFYRHFDSKEELLVAALESAFGEIEAMLEERHSQTHSVGAAADSFQKFYLSDAHVDAIESGCPAAALGGDIGRGSDALKAPFGAGVNRMIQALAQGLSGSATENRKHAARRLAMMAGAVMLARASDPVTARAVLLACRMKS